ncbi:hypothetical protein, partial [Klebsiella quasipneumoniae]|uniref:hypothetical protein n=1 Tax=Klebsiella quasipneumoniae TaxID=1463165 RepID=UPI001C65B10D
SSEILTPMSVAVSSTVKIRSQKLVALLLRPPILWATHSVLAAFPFAIGNVLFILLSPQLTQYFSFCSAMAAH